MASESRPDGIAGLLIDEIQLIGITRTARHYVALVRSGTRPYSLRPGDQLFDGDVITIAKDEVVFKQEIQKPSGQKAFREVVLRLGPTGA